MSLPSGYKWLKYIQSTGTQYINTNFKPNNLTRVILDAQMVGATSQSTLYCPFGCRSGDLFFELYKASTANWNLTFLWGSTYSQYFSIDYSARHTFEINKNVAKVDDSTLTYSNKTFQLSYNLFIGADNDAGRKTAITPLKIYSCQIYDNGTLVRDFIPCQKPDGTVGLWDDVNSVFYGNAGTGTFTAGPVKEPPPAPATLQHLLSVRLAWSAVDGATKYNVYRDDALLTSTTETTFIDLAAAENTEYTYAVSAVGPGGESAKTTLTVYTKSGYFLYKPYIESATFQ